MRKASYTSRAATIVFLLSVSGAVRGEDSKHVVLEQDPPSLAKSRQAVDRLADCVVRRAPDQVEGALMAVDNRNARVAAVLYSQAASACIQSAQGLPAAALSGSLTRALYLRNAGGALGPSDAVDALATYEDRPGKNDDVDYLMYADCVVSADVELGRGLLKARPGSAAERRALDAISANAPQCGAELEESPASALPINFAVAEVLFRRSRGLSFGPANAPLSSTAAPHVECESARPDVCVVQPIGNRAN